MKRMRLCTNDPDRKYEERGGTIGLNNNPPVNPFQIHFDIKVQVDLNSSMYNIFTRFLSIFAFTLSFTGCQQELEAPDPTSGEIRFTQFIALGDGYSAGYSNEGLTAASQETSYPFLISQQLNLIGPTDFRLPLVEGSGSGHWVLDSLTESVCDDIPPQANLLWSSGNPNWDKNISSQGPFSNLGVPFLRLMDIEDSSRLSANPFFTRILPTSDISYLQFLEEFDPDFFTFWLGTYDILSVGLTGGIGIDELPTQEEFSDQLIRALAVLNESSFARLRGLVGNIPYPTDLPYFHHLPHEYRPLNDCNSSPSPIYITTGVEEGNIVRIATEEDYILLSADSLLASTVTGSSAGSLRWGLGADAPLPDEFVLDQTEAQRLRLKTDIINNAIRSTVLNHNLQVGDQQVVLVNLNREFYTVANGLRQDGLLVTNDYLTGDMFSLDGIYLTPRGNAIVANAFIRTANEAFGASIPTISITDYPGVAFP